MADIERLATSTSAGMHRTVGRLGRFVTAALLFTGLIGLATFITGMWVFEGSLGWIVVGGILCSAPLAAALASWWLVRATVATLAGLLDDLRRYLMTSPRTQDVLIDYDSGMRRGRQARTYSGLREELTVRKRELPALYAGVRAITGVPGFAAISVIGTLIVGAVGTVLLLIGLSR